MFTNYFWAIAIVIFAFGSLMSMFWYDAFTTFKKVGWKNIKGYIAIIAIIVLMSIESLCCYVLVYDASNIKLRDAYHHGFKLEINTRYDAIDGEMIIHKADTVFNVNYKTN
jgi:hypothetical protein